MANDKYSFQYCQKLVLLSPERDKVFLAKRKGEADYDGTWAFIGGKMETSDQTILAGLKREKNEEIGEQAKVMVYPAVTRNLFFVKKDGSSMILPHYLAIYADGEIRLNKQEYSEYRWVAMGQELDELKPKIENIPELVEWAMGVDSNRIKSDFVAI